MMKARISASIKMSALKLGQAPVKATLSARTPREASIAAALKDTRLGPPDGNAGTWTSVQHVLESAETDDAQILQEASDVFARKVSLLPQQEISA